jgi:hypothetical protein
LRQVGFGLFQRRFETTRVDLEEEITSVDELAFLVIFRNQTAGNLRPDISVDRAVQRANPFLTTGTSFWSAPVTSTSGGPRSGIPDSCFEQPTKTETTRHRTALSDQGRTTPLTGMFAIALASISQPVWNNIHSSIDIPARLDFKLSVLISGWVVQAAVGQRFTLSVDICSFFTPETSKSFIFQLLHSLPELNLAKLVARKSHEPKRL